MDLRVSCENCNDREMEEQKTPFNGRLFVCSECGASVRVFVSIDPPQW